MKNLVILYIGILFAPAIVQAQAQGIQFNQGKWQDILLKAKNERKLIFVDAFTTWCGPCKMMDRYTFPDTKAGEFYNANFVNYKLDMEKGEGPSIAGKYDVTAYPTLLFVNYKGELVQKIEGYQDAKKLLQLGKEALNPGKNISNLQLQYEAGTEDPTLLYNYATALKALGKDYQEVAKKYFSTQPEKSLLNDNNWQAIRLLTYDLQSREFQYLLAKQKKFTGKFGAPSVETKISETCRDAVLAAALTQQEDKYIQAITIAKKYLKDGGKTAARLQMSWAYARKDWPSYASSSVSYFATHQSTNVDELYQAVAIFVDHIVDPTELDLAEGWARQSTALENTYRTHLLYAAILNKTGKKQDALRSANLALTLAEKEPQATRNEAVKQTQALLQKLKKG